MAPLGRAHAKSLLRLWHIGLYAQTSACSIQPPPTMTDFSIADHLASIEDHRRDQGKLHRLSDILTKKLGMLEVSSGAEPFRAACFTRRIAATPGNWSNHSGGMKAVSNGWAVAPNIPVFTRSVSIRATRQL